MSRKNTSLLREWVESIFIALILAVFLKSFVFEFIEVDGNSMLPTLQDHDRLIVSKVSYSLSQPKHGDIIVFQYTYDPTYCFIKRVIAVESDTVEIKDGKVFVNDKPLQEPYTKEETLGDFTKRVIPADTVFVLGDNRNNSKDSRFEDIGFVSIDAIKGKAFYMIWPFQKLSKIH
ncbi:MAG: signal peptidase I [Bacillota bacterium]